MKFRSLASLPVPVWGAICYDKEEAPDWSDPGPLRDVVVVHEAFAFRGVELERLPTVLAYGVDVTPTDDPIYIDDLDKAWEYGGFPKVVMAFRWHGLVQTFRVLPADASEVELAETQATYPYEYPYGDRRWFSRLDDPNPARRGYELAHGRWLPGNPFDSLRAVFVFGSEENLSWAQAQAQAANATPRQPIDR